MKTKLKRIATLCASLMMVACCSLSIIGNAFAGSFSVSPMNDKISLTPGETYYGSFNVTNPGTATEDFTFTTSVEPFSNADETGSVDVGKDASDYNKIVDWITVLDGEGTISPNQTQTVHYIIDVPYDAPAGGQYAGIAVQSATGESVEGALNIQQSFRIIYLIYANVAGETVHDGTINSVEVPSFLLDGNISGTASITNNGNAHDGATYTLQVFPLFSSEEVFTNEEDPDTALIMPEATIMKTTAWDNTPSVGVYNIKYTVEFNGETTTTEKMVIKCPIWLLFIIVFGIIFIIFWLIMKSKSRKKSKR